MERLLSELVEKLEKAHRDTLLSAILYGSAASESGKDRLSDLNVLCVLKQVTPSELRDSEPVFRWWREMKNPAPLLLSEEEARNATDCFSIEFTDMKHRRRVLYGIDLIAEIEIDYSFYRAEVEHELRAKLLRLRQKAGGVLSERDLLLRLMADSVSTFCVLLRHALLLGGGEPVFGRREVVAAASERFGMKPDAFLRLLDLREDRVRAKDLDPVALLGTYLGEIQSVVNAVDVMKK